MTTGRDAGHALLFGRLEDSYLPSILMAESCNARDVQLDWSRSRLILVVQQPISLDTDSI
jgi:hypothetical protein